MVRVRAVSRDSGRRAAPPAKGCEFPPGARPARGSRASRQADAEPSANAVRRVRWDRKQRIARTDPSVARAPKRASHSDLHHKHHNSRLTSANGMLPVMSALPSKANVVLGSNWADNREVSDVRKCIVGSHWVSAFKPSTTGCPRHVLSATIRHPATNMQQSYDFESLSNRWLAIEPRPCLLELSSQAEQCRLVAVARYQLN